MPWALAEVACLLPALSRLAAPDRFAQTGTVVPTTFAPTSTATVPAIGVAAIEMPAIRATAVFGACRFSTRSAVADASDGESLHGSYVPPGPHDDREDWFGGATVGNRCRPWCIGSTSRDAGRYSQRRRRRGLAHCHHS